MNFEEQRVKAVPEAIRNRPTPQSTLFKSAPESMKNRSLPPPEGTPAHQKVTWPGQPKDPPEVNDMVVDEQRREAASANSIRAARPAQGSAMEIDHAQLLLEFDAIYAWTPRDRVIVKRTTYLA